MSRLRTTLKVTSLALALTLFVLAGLAGWLAFTESGLTRLVALAESLDTVTLRVSGARGTLAGPLRLDSLELGTDRVSLRADAVELEHRLPSLLFGHLSVTRLKAGSLALDIAPSTAAPPDRTPQFMPRWLSLGIGRAQVDEFDLGLPNGARQRYRDISLSGQVTHARIELDHVAADAGAWAAQGKVGLVARRPLRLQGELDWTLRTQPALQGTMTARGDLRQLFASVAMRAPAAASADVTLLDLDRGARWEARVDTRGFDLSPWVASPPVGPLSGFLEGTGTLDEYRIAGHLGGPGLPPQGLDLESVLRRQGPALELEALTAAAPESGLVATASGSIRLGEAPGLQLRASWRELAWPLDAAPVVTSAEGTLELGGWSQLTFTGDAVVALPDLPAARVVASGQADRGGITVLRSTLQSDAGRAEATGYFGFGPGLPWKVAASLRAIDLGRFADGLDSRLDFDLSGSGFGAGDDLAWGASLGPVTGTLRDYPVSGSGYVLHQRGRYDFREFDFDVGPASIEASGSLGTETAFAARVTIPDLAGLADQAGGSLEATIEARSTGTPLPDRPNLRADVALRGRDLRWGSQQAAVLSADADLDLSDRETSWIRARVAGLTIGGQTVNFVRVALDGLASGHAFDLQVGAGERAASLVGSGRYAEGVYRLTADRIESDAPALQPWSIEAPMNLSLAAGAFTLEGTCFVHAPRRICLQGDWRRETGWSATASIADFPLEALRVDLPGEPGYRGVLDLNLRASGEPKRPWTANARGSLRDAVLTYKTPSGRLQELDLGVTNLQLDSLPDRHELLLAMEDTDALQFRAEASAPRTGGVDMADAPLRGEMTLSTTRLGLLPLLVPDIDRAGGRLGAELTLAGTPGSPLLGGTIALDDGELDFYPTNLRLRQVAARIALLDTGLRIEAGGKAGDGSFRTDGTLDWQERRLRGDLRLTGERLLVADVPEARIEASPDLSFRIAGRDVSVRGSVTVPAARIEPRQLVGAVTVSADEVVVGKEAEDERADPYRVTAELRLNLGKDVRLSAFGLRGRLEGSVLAQARPDEVATASGELEIKDGEYRAYGKELDVERGRLLFAGGPVSDPGVDLRARKELPGYEVGVLARGRLRRPELSLYSEPSMPQSQIASLLLVGRRLDNLDPGDRQALGGSSGDVAAQGGAILAGQLGRAIGLDEVSLETDDDHDASLVIGKFLSPRLYVSYGISLSAAINTFKLRYTVGDRWMVSAEAGEQASADIEYTIDR